MASPFILLAIMALSCSITVAYDAGPLQDFCVGDPNSPVLVNGVVCKDPKTVTADDFFFSGFRFPGNTSNAVGSKVTPAFIGEFPGLNTLGIAMARLDFAPGGLNVPHSHPRASEILTVLEGTLEAGFVTSNPDNRLFRKLLQKGDAFLFPQGLIHFQRNIGSGNAMALVALSSQNPGRVNAGDGMFGSQPYIAPDILAQALHVDQKIIYQIQTQF